MKVRESMRVNPLSLKPGGVEVRITFITGCYRDYDKVKYPEQYVEQCFKLDDSIVTAQIIGYDPPMPLVYRSQWLVEQQLKNKD